MCAGVVGVIVDPHHDGDVLALGRGRDDDLLRARGEMALGLLDVGEQPRGFNYQLHAQILPRKLSGRFGADHLDFLAVDDQHIVVRLVGG